MNEGVVVEQSRQEGTVQEPTLLEGDLLLSWRLIDTAPWLERTEGSLLSPFAFLELLEGVATDREMELTLVRGGQTISVPFRPAAQTVTVLPLLAVGAIGQGFDQLFAAGERTSREGRPILASWFFLRAADAGLLTGQRAETDAAIGRALREAESFRDIRQTARVWSLAGDRLEAGNDYPGAAHCFRTSIALRQSASTPDMATARVLLRLGILALNLRDLEQAEDLHRQALSIITALAPNGLEHAELLDSLGANIAYQRGNLDAANKLWKRAFDIRHRSVPASLPFARSLFSSGFYALEKGRLDEAERCFNSALLLQERLAPGSLDLARSLHNLGNVFFQRGDLERARALYLRGLEIRERIAPGSLQMASSLANLSGVAYNQDELDKAEEYLTRALLLKRQFPVHGLATTRELRNLGNVQFVRGNIDAAENFYRQALVIEMGEAPGSLGHAMSLETLGMIANARGDLESARDNFLRSLDIRQRQAPEGLMVAHSLDHLGVITELLGDLDSAERYYRRALVIRERLSPIGDLADTLTNFGVLLRNRGDLDQAELLIRRALKLNESSSADLSAATCLEALATIEQLRGRHREAERLLQQALVLRAKVPGKTKDELDTLFLLAVTEIALGQNEKALTFLERAESYIESQLSRLGGALDVQAGFLSSNRDVDREYLALLVKLRRYDEAFAASERYRGRILLGMLADRPLAATDLPSGIAQRVRRIHADYDRIQTGLFDQNLHNRVKQEALRSQLRRLRDERAYIIEELRRKSPGDSLLRQPQPLGFEGVQAVLDPGTVLLSFNVGRERTNLFIVQQGQPLSSRILSVSEAELRREVNLLRNLVSEARPGHFGSTVRFAALLEMARRLYAQLIEPAAEQIARGQRILILADGPLHLLPWGMLIRDLPRESGQGHSWQYLIEWRPIHLMLSATLFAESKKARRWRDPNAATLVAFGDPVYPPTEDRPESLRAEAAPDPASRGRSFEPLPAARQEVERIAGRFPRARIYLGREATEEQAKAISKDTVYLHFAAHAVLDEHLPLNSAVALTPPDPRMEGQDNGFLQAWEIFEGLRLDTDLVVLSACETGLGKELGGEGLLGLTSAFQYAGAHTVLASLWQVSDQATAELMTRFYDYLRKGQSKDEALRTAQIELLRTAIKVTDQKDVSKELDATAPFYWAAFQLYGDWR
jgi:CHAT domain-containing protein/Tfp pilus assembly protein PilF